jgi:threonine synthase
VGVLFPKGAVAPRQERQLTCWDDNVRSFAVRGTFDDCQRLVKAAFRREGWPRRGRLSSANSINVGRLLPQAAYYAAAALAYLRAHGSPAGFVVPSGNLGNAVGAFWAKRLGFPLRHVALAANANRVVPDWFRTGRWEPRRAVPTLANAMDVGDPSNMERMLHLYPSREALLDEASALAVDDATIRRVIAAGPGRWGRVWCPHTATAVHLREQLPTAHWVVVATAHPAKFDTIVEPLVGRTIELPPGLAELLERPSRLCEIDPDLERLVAEMD